ncbi:MAG: histidine--tRNA ligase [bacterium]|nr:histidine--tRNA ligase [bacterium]
MDIASLRGTYDIFPPQSRIWESVELEARRIFNVYGCSEIRTPIIEDTRLFTRSIGEGTDIVNKEMYTFPDRKGRSITLRPEGTASVVRAYLQHSLYKDQGLCRFFYIGPMFRYERPQAGRNRQFYQLGTEFLGSTHPYYDAESIALLTTFFKTLGITDAVVKLNSVGSRSSKENYSLSLKDYFAPFIKSMCEDCITRFEKNTLRILDCKNPACRETIKGAPSTEHALNQEDAEHFHSVKEYLCAMNVRFEIEPRLVRGLDYYTNTIFEVVHTRLGSQDALGGGGRYNNLVEEMGGPSTGAVGFAVGIDRLVMVLEKILSSQETALSDSLDVYILNPNDSLSADHIVMLHALRSCFVKADMCTEQKSFKAQMRTANKLNARFVLIHGEDEIRQSIIKLKNMTQKTEEIIPYTTFYTAVEKVIERIGKK